MKTISYLEYRRRIFNQALLECFCKVHNQILNGDCADTECDDARMADMAKRLCNTFFTNELNLNNMTISQTKRRLAEASEFVQDCVDVAEDIATKKSDTAKEEKMEITDDTIELSEEEKGLIDQLFDVKSPTPQIDSIRDATVKALLAEDRKAEEIKNSIDIAQSRVAAGEPPETLEETVKRLNRIGPTSLMNAIMNNVSAAAVRDVNNAGKFTSIGKVMSENATNIKDRATAIYVLYEMANVLGIHKYTPSEIRSISLNIFYDK